MYRFLLLLLPALLVAGQARFARLGEMAGTVDVQLQPADPWQPGERNLTLTEAAWLRTAAASRLEIELDDGSALRLGPDSLVELSDYSRLSTGQRITVLSLDRGIAYFTGEPAGRDALSLAVPGAQITLQRGARVRVEALDVISRISVIEGSVRLSCAAAELDVREGQTVKVEPSSESRFSLEREVARMELDQWSEERDKALAAPASGVHVPMRFGLADLDAAGEWLSTDVGAAWRPKVAEGWAPFQKGRWRWYQMLGYNWVSDEQWGWLPYHFGRWLRKGDLGWVWVPPARPVFKPGDVYWLYGRQLAGWGPLAPGEVWTPSAAPQQFLNVNTTYASFTPDARVIDPAGFTARPSDPLRQAVVFALALPSPAFAASHLEATRPALRVGASRAIEPMAPDAAFNPDAPPPPPELPPAVATNPTSDAPPVVQPGPPPDDPGPPPPVVYYPVPDYTGIVVINPPEHPDYSRRNPNYPNGRNGGGNPQPAVQPPPVRGGGGTGRPSQPGASGGSTPQSNAPPPAASVPDRRIDPPRVGSPAPRGTDRPRVEGIPVKTPPPREQPRQERPAPPPAPAPKAEPKVESKPEAKSDSRPAGRDQPNSAPSRK